MSSPRPNYRRRHTCISYSSTFAWLRLVFVTVAAEKEMFYIFTFLKIIQTHWIGIEISETHPCFWGPWTVCKQPHINSTSLHEVCVNNILRYVETRISYVCLSFLKNTPPVCWTKGLQFSWFWIWQRQEHSTAQHGLSTGRGINYKLPSYHENSFKISFEAHITYWPF